MKQNEINDRLTEIRTIAAGLPQGGDIEKLKIELTKLASWTNQTFNYLGSIEERCRYCFGECDCHRS